MKQLFQTQLFQTAYRVGNCFTRKRKLGFETLFLFLLRQYSYSLPINIQTFLDEFPQSGISHISKQAVSKARKGIHVQAFQELLTLSSSAYYKLSKSTRTWHGFYVLAIDGTKLQMPQTPKNLETFGSSSNQTGIRFAMASASLLYDTLNDILLDAQIGTYQYGERKFAKEHILAFSAFPFLKKQIFVLDRGYLSVDLCRAFQDAGYLFVMRVRSNAPAIRNMEGRDGWILYGDPYSKTKQVCVRALRIPLDSGEEEYLLTNLSDPTMTIEDFKELYFLRWPIETKYKELKYRLQTEQFSGNTPLCVRQDFYIRLFLSNLVSIIKKDTDEIIKKKTQKRKSFEYHYQTNRGVLIHQVKKYLLYFFFRPKSSEKAWEKIIGVAIETRSQVRQNRTYERKAKHTRRKYHHNLKPC